MTNDYHFITHWRIEGTAEEVYELISTPLDYPRWWPAVYLAAHEIEKGDHRGIGRRVRFHTKGWLPYTLRWESCSTGSERPSRLAIRATGDFNGRGIWTITQDGQHANVEFDWKLTAEKPLLRYLSFLLKPVFAANHRWAMARGQESLSLEIARRHLGTSKNSDQVPPPGPNKTS